jgi:class 3 adenylate cyclase
MSPHAPSSVGKQITVVFTDLADSVALKRKLGIPTYRDQLLRPHDELVRSVIEDSAGSILQDTGDGFLAHFPSSAAAVIGCLRLQHAIHARKWDAERPRVRIGIHTGDVTELRLEDGSRKVVGLTVDLAARVMSLALPGQVLLTSHVYQNSEPYVREHPATGGNDTRPELKWVKHGPYLFKGNDEAVEVYEVGAFGIAPLREPEDTEKAQRESRLLPGADWRPANGLRVPQREHWVLQEKLGAGGSGEVWLAGHDRFHDRQVFKFCLEAEQLYTLRREVAIFHCLQGALGERRDIARITDFEFDRPPYFLMAEHTPEGSLADWDRKHGGIKSLPLADRLELVAEVADTLAAAHPLGVIHADIKPGNILLRKEGERLHAALADFGIGRITDLQQFQQRHITLTDMSQALQRSSGRGTPAYAAPELQGGHDPTTLSDIYSLGVVLYQMVVGELWGQKGVFGSGWEKEVEDDFLREDISLCVDRDPGKRLRSAAELADRLRRLDQRRAERQAELQRQQVDARRQKKEQWRKRLFRALALLVGLLLVLVVVVAVAWFNTNEARKRADDAKQKAQQARARERSLRYFYSVLGAHRAWSDRAPALMQDMLRRAPPELRDWEWYYLNGLAHADLCTLTGHTGEVLSVAFSPEDDYLASGSRDQTVKLWDVGDVSRVKELCALKGPMAGPVSGVAFARRNGRLVLAAASGKKAFLWDVSTREVVRALDGPRAQLHCVAFSPDGSRLAAGGADGSVWVLKTDSGGLVNALA